MYMYICIVVDTTIICNSANPRPRRRALAIRMRGILLYACAPLIDGKGQATPSTTGLPLMLSSQASYVIVSGFRAALDLDTYPLSNLIGPRCAERLNLVEVSQS